MKTYTIQFSNTSPKSVEFTEQEFEAYGVLTIKEYLFDNAMEHEEFSGDSRSIEYKNVSGDQDEVIITVDEREMDLFEEIKDELNSFNIRHNVAGTGTIYIPIQFDGGVEAIRISDHDANVRNIRNNPNYEIDINKIDDAWDFVKAVENAIDSEDLEWLEDYQYEQF